MGSAVGEACGHAISCNHQILHGRREIRQGGKERGPKFPVGLAAITDENVVVDVIAGHEFVDQIRVVFV